MFCENCGKPIKEGTGFCSGCGKPANPPTKLIAAEPGAAGKTESLFSQNSVVEPFTPPAMPSKIIISPPAGTPPQLNLKQKKKSKLPIVIAVVMVLAILGSAAAVFGVSALNTKKYDDMIDTGNKYLEELKYEEAVETFLDAIDIKPKREEGYIGAATGYIKLDKPEKAKNLLEKGLENVKEPSDKFMNLCDEVGIEDEKIANTTTSDEEDNQTTIISKTELVSNVSANVANGAMMTTDGENIYYVTSPGYYSPSIYKFRINSDEDIKVNIAAATGVKELFYVNGGIVYEAYQENSPNVIRYISMQKVDDPSSIKTVLTLNSAVEEYYVNGNGIYYYINDSNNGKKGLWCYNYKTETEVFLADGNFYKIAVNDQWLFFSSRSSGRSPDSIFRINLQNLKVEQIYSGYNRTLQISKDRVWFCTGGSSDQGETITSIDFNGNNKEIIAIDNLFTFNVIENDDIYYTTDKGIYRLYNDEKIEVTTQYTHLLELCVIGDILCFNIESMDMPTVFYIINSDGKTLRSIEGAY